MFINIDHNSKLPIYEQIKNQIMYMASTGKLQPGDKLPSVRELASILRVNPTSTARSFRELEYEGIIRTKRGLGTFIVERVAKLDKSVRISTMTDEIKKLLATAHQMGFSRNQIHTLFNEQLKYFGGENG